MMTFLTTRYWRAIISVFAGAVLALASVSFLDAQSTGPEQKFDVISVKPNLSAKFMFGIRDSTPGKFSTTNTSVRDLLEEAYDVKEAQIDGAPAWVATDKFDVDAKVDDALAVQEQSLSRDQELRRMRLRVQSLLADRFALKLHHETKDMPVLALVVAKGGTKMVESPGTPASADSPGPPGSVTMSTKTGNPIEWVLTSNGAPLRILINALSGQPEVRGRVLIDRSGLTGTYVYKLQWAQQNLSAGGQPSSEASGPSLFTALEDQLGLRLESTKAPVDVLVVDHVEQPSPN